MRESERARQKKRRASVLFIVLSDCRGHWVMYGRRMQVRGASDGHQARCPWHTCRLAVSGACVCKPPGARGRSHQITPPCEIDVSHHGVRERAPAVGTDS